MNAPAAFSLALRELTYGEPSPVRVLAAFPTAVYLEVVQHPAAAPPVVSIVTSDGLPHPNSAVLARPVDRALTTCHRHLAGSIGDGRIVAGDLAVTVSRWWNPRPALRPTSPADLTARVAAVEQVLGPATAASDARLEPRAASLAAALRAGDLDAALVVCRRLVGYGSGLTPSGDDVLCGLLASAKLLGRALGDPPDPLVDQVAAGAEIAARDRTTALSHALLQHAARGQVAGPAAGLLRALAGTGLLRPSVDRLLAVGSTSGGDLALGIVAGARLAIALHARAAAPPALPGRPPS